MTPESRNSSFLGKGDKQIPAEMYTQAKMEELPFIYNGELYTPL
jgi:hypothetical protein